MSEIAGIPLEDYKDIVGALSGKGLKRLQKHRITAGSGKTYILNLHTEGRELFLDVVRPDKGTVVFSKSAEGWEYCEMQ